MIKQVRRLPLYFSLILFLFTGSFILNISLSKTDSFLLLNQFHNDWLDIFFTGCTYLGDGMLSIAVILFLASSKKIKKAATLLLAYSGSGLLAQLLKSIYKEPRPKLYFEQILFKYTHFVEGITLHGSNSFPSGHTTSVFALATVLVLVFKKHRISIPCFLVAVLVGYSRIYLGQHFLQDVLFGAFTGVGCALISYYCVWKQKLLKIFRPLRRKSKRFAVELTYPQWI